MLISYQRKYCFLDSLLCPVIFTFTNVCNLVYRWLLGLLLSLIGINSTRLFQRRLFKRADFIIVEVIVRSRVFKIKELQPTRRWLYGVLQKIQLPHHCNLAKPLQHHSDSFHSNLERMTQEPMRKSGDNYIHMYIILCPTKRKFG